MFQKVFENVAIRTTNAPKRGLCLEAINREGQRIYMDICGMNPALVPDGSNAYLFGNSLIIVTRWSDMTDDEKETVETSELCLAVNPYQHVQFSLRINGRWSDVFTTLQNCYNGLNDENAPVKEAIFIFADTHDEDYIISRSVVMHPFVQKFLQKCNASSHKAYSLDNEVENLRFMAELDAQKDFCDMLYDLIWEESKDTSRRAKADEPDDIPNGIYMEISSDNTVTNMYLNEAKPKQEPMSSEVKLYLKLAEEGNAEAQYNMGVCYETGDGVAKNYEKALQWYRKAANQNFAKAQYNLGVCIYNGYGTAANAHEAARLFLLAANQGNMYAQFNMGVCCYSGEGVEKDIFAAVNWFEKAAAQGHPEAKKILSAFQ